MVIVECPFLNVHTLLLMLDREAGFDIYTMYVLSYCETASSKSAR